MADAESTFLQILDVLHRHKIQKVIVDGREINGAPSAAERFFYGEFVADAVIARLGRAMRGHPQFAYVLIPPVLDPRRLGETVAVNRGMFVKAFDNLKEALNWLGMASSNEAVRCDCQLTNL